MFVYGPGGSTSAPRAFGGDAVTAKRRGLSITRGKDGRLSFAVSCAATLSPLKVVFLALVLVACVCYLAAPLFGEERMRKRVVDLEKRLAKKLSWVLRHKDRIAQDEGVAVHLDGDGDGNGDAEGEASGPRVRVVEELPPLPEWNDGRKHLVTPRGSVSKLAEAAAPHTSLHAFDDHYLCGEDSGVTEAEVVKKTIALAAISWRAPLSLENSLKSWERNGLLDVVDERMLFLNSPTQQDRDLARRYGFDVYTSWEHDGNLIVGPSIAYLSGNSSADYILFMEKDFELTAPKDEVVRELYAGVQHLARGVDVYRLRGKTDWPAEGMPDCCNRDNVTPHPCPYHSNWKSGGYFGDHQNWLLMFCDPNVMQNSNGRLVQCTKEPEAPTSFCFGSGDSGYSNNPHLFRREWFNERLRGIALEERDNNQWRNNYFEFRAQVEWLAWSPPAKICVSERGIFTHREIDQ